MHAARDVLPRDPVDPEAALLARAYALILTWGAGQRAQVAKENRAEADQAGRDSSDATLTESKGGLVYG